MNVKVVYEKSVMAQRDLTLRKHSFFTKFKFLPYMIIKKLIAVRIYHISALLDERQSPIVTFSKFVYKGLSLDLRHHDT